MFSGANYYPGTYTVAFDSKRQVYEILFAALQKWETSKLPVANVR
jgi:hypothetical protein